MAGEKVPQTTQGRPVGGSQGLERGFYQNRKDLESKGLVEKSPPARKRGGGGGKGNQMNPVGQGRRLNDLGQETHNRAGLSFLENTHQLSRIPAGRNSRAL